MMPALSTSLVRAPPPNFHPEPDQTRYLDRSPNGLGNEGRHLPLLISLRTAHRKQLTAFCWNVNDGQSPKSDLADFQKQRALPELPSVLDYAGYVVSAILESVD